MKEIKIRKTHNTPNVFLSEIEGFFEISGPSYSNNISPLYQSVLDWVEEEIPNITNSVIFSFDFELLNSVSYKFIIEIIMRLNDFVKIGKEIKIDWCYDKDDDDMYFTGKDLSDLFELPIDLKRK